MKISTRPQTRALFGAIVAASALWLAGCQPMDGEAESPEPTVELEVECQDPRPEVCTFEYRPVCGLRDSNAGGADWETYSNGCAACSDARVVGYREGACSELATTNN